MGNTGLGYAGYGYATHANHAGCGLGAYGLNAGYYGVHGVAAGIKSAPCVNSMGFPFPVPDASVVMLTPRLRPKPKLPPTTMEVTTVVMPDTPITDTDTVWAVTTVMDSIPPESPPTPVAVPAAPSDLSKVLASKWSLPSSRNLRAMLRYMLYTFRMHQIMSQNKNK